MIALSDFVTILLTAVAAAVSLGAAVIGVGITRTGARLRCTARAIGEGRIVLPEDHDGLEFAALAGELAEMYALVCSLSLIRALAVPAAMVHARNLSGAGFCLSRVLRHQAPPRMGFTETAAVPLHGEVRGGRIPHTLD
jgi:hypothetical protein